MRRSAGGGRRAPGPVLPLPGHVADRRATARAGRRRRRRAAWGVVVAGLTLAACGGTGSSPAHRSSEPGRGSTTSTTTARPTTTTTPTAPVPAGFEPISVTFVSATLGWVLGVVPGGAGTRLAAAHTTDGGTTWSTAPAPPVALGTGAAPGDASIRFADPTDGWIMAPPTGSTGEPPSTLWSTHDGGASWHQVAVPGGGEVAALEASDGVVHLVTIEQNGSGMHFYAAPAASDHWTISVTNLPIGAGPVPSAQLALHGAAGWLVENDRTVIAGARLTSGNWTRWTPPCTDANGPAFVAASSATDLVAVCDEGLWGPPAPGTGGPWLFTSADAGTHFAPVGPIDSPAGSGAQPFSVATPPGDPQVVVVGGLGLVATFDGGQSWKTVYTPPANHTAHLVGFTTASQGVAITVGGTGTSTLLMTHDDGATWKAVTLSGAAAS